MMPGSDSEDSGFGDDMVLTSTQTAHIGSAGPARGEKTQPKGANGMAQVRTACMLVVHKYDLSTEVDRSLFAREMILQRSTAEIDTDVNTLSTVESKMLCAKDTAIVVEFWSTEQWPSSGSPRSQGSGTSTTEMCWRPQLSLPCSRAGCWAVQLWSKRYCCTS